jgi:hypothetical protein
LTMPAMIAASPIDRLLAEWLKNFRRAESMP